MKNQINTHAHTHTRTLARIHPHTHTHTQPFDGETETETKNTIPCKYPYTHRVEHTGRKNHFKRTMIFLSSMLKCVHEHWTPLKSMLAFWLLNQEIHSQIDIEHWTTTTTIATAYFMCVCVCLSVCVCLFIRFIFACIIVIWWSCWFGACISLSNECLCEWFSVSFEFFKYWLSEIGYGLNSVCPVFAHTCTSFALRNFRNFLPNQIFIEFFHSKSQ